MTRRFLVLAFFLNILPSVYAGEESVILDVIRTKAVSSVQRIHSIEFTSVTESTVYGKTAVDLVESRFVSYLKYWSRDGKFRCEIQLTPTSGRGEAQDIVSIYDERRYQTFDKKTGGLMLANSSQFKEPAMTPNPLLTPYLFLLDSRLPMALALIRDESHWNKKFNTAKYLKKVFDKESQMNLDVVEIPGPETDTLFEVYFSRELEYFPLYFIGKKKGVHQILVSARGTKILNAPVEPVIIALEPIIKSFSDDGKTLAFMDVSKIDPDSIKLNQPVDESLFEFPMTRAETVTDVDKGTQVNVGGRLSTKEMQSRGPLRWLWPAGAAFAVVAGVVVFLRWRKRSA